ncbi:MAG: DUF305 domain-containing protein [Candidatus Planktophila sp.]
MKIEFDNKTGATVLVIALLFFGLGFAINNGEDHDGVMGNMHGNTVNNSSYSASDIMFAQMMIPHHQQAIAMSDLALVNSQNPDIFALAQQIKSAQAPEIAQMKSWLTANGTTLMGAHGMSMEGMLTDAELSDLKMTTGNSFDKLFLKGMIAHHQGALTTVAMIANSDNSEARQLAKNIKTSQSAEIELMKKYLASMT